MALKGKKPKQLSRRLKLFMHGEAGVGKTTAVCQMPCPYIIDTERGTDNYADLIESVGGSVFQSNDSDEIIEEIRTLRSEKHDFQTLGFDSHSTFYHDLLEKAELKVGSDYGGHYREANKVMRRITNLMLGLDMNLVVTAHSKPVYGDDMKILSYTFDGWKKLDYIFDLVLELRRGSPTQRYACVKKTRIESFPDGETFEWTREALAERYNLKDMERSATVVKVATPRQVEEIETLTNMMTDGNVFVGKCLDRAGVDTLADLTTEQAAKMVAHFTKAIGGLHV
jgi:hypothetical protein